MQDNVVCCCGPGMPLAALAGLGSPTWRGKYCCVTCPVAHKVDAAILCSLVDFLIFEGSYLVAPCCESYRTNLLPRRSPLVMGVATNSGAVDGVKRV